MKIYSTRMSGILPYYAKVINDVLPAVKLEGYAGLSSRFTRMEKRKRIQGFGGHAHSMG